MSQFLFSVVIPSHNRLSLLQRAVKALESQKFSKEKFEVIIVLSPEDISLEWLKTYQTSLHLKYIAPKEDIWKGTNVSFKRNFGALLGVGQWIAFLDDDCIPQPEWLMSAERQSGVSGIYGIEGLTVTPPDSPKTLTWKGLQQLALPNGYQTCNMFYRKEVFTEISQGFDAVNFPWFLEDTDLAWTVLDAGKDIVYESQCVVVHPVGVSASWRLLHEAKGAGLKVRLFLKHPRQYEVNHMKTLRWSQYMYFFLIAACILSLIYSLELSGYFLMALVAFLTIHMTKLFWGLQFALPELFAVAWRTAVFPFIALWALWREKRRSQLSLSAFFKLIRP